MNPEEMLKAIIVKMGKFKFLLDYDFKVVGGTIGLYPGEYYKVLEILLDPAGLRAAYGDEPMFSVKTGDSKKDIFMNYTAAYLVRKGGLPAHWHSVSVMILLAWLSKPEGDTDAAIKTAFDLLPQA